MTGQLRQAGLRSIPQIAARLLAELQSVRARFAQTIAAGLLAQCAAAVVVVGTAVVVGDAAAGKGPGLALIIAMAIAAVISGVATWWEMYASHDLAYLVMAGMRVRLFHQLRRIVPSRRDRRHSGDLAALALSDVEALEWVFAHVFGQVLTAMVMLVGAGVAMTFIQPVLCWVLAAAAVSVLSVPWWRRRRADQRMDEHRRLAARLSADVVDTVQGMPVLTSAGSLGRRLVDHNTASRNLDRLAVRDSVRAGVEAAIIELVVAAAGIAGLLLVIGDLRAGVVHIARAPVVLAWFGLALAPLAAVGGALRNLGTTRSAGTRLADVLDMPASLSTVAGAPSTVPASPDAAALALSDVHFAYHDRRPVLRGVNLTIAPGEIVGLAGPSGAGKSTIAALVQRFFDPDDGAIRLNGADLRDLPDERLRAQVAAVAQRVDLLATSLRENLLLGLPDDHPGRGDAAIDAATRTAHLDEVIDRLPAGLDEPIGERGTTLSGGERLRVALARALLRDPTVLVLDEVVAGFDAELEQRVLAAVRGLPNRPAVLIIAHRTSTMAACDRVVTLDSGTISDRPPGAVGHRGDPAPATGRGPFRRVQ